MAESLGLPLGDLGGGGPQAAPAQARPLPEEAPAGPRRERRRSQSVRLIEDRRKIAKRVHDLFTRDWEAHARGRAERLERNAKLRQWTRGEGGPWQDSSDVRLPDMAEASHRTQDTLYNAVISGRPTAKSKAVEQSDTGQEPAIDRMLDHQLFVEQPGEDILAEWTQCFVDDPAVFAFVSWVRERRRVVDRRLFDPIPNDTHPRIYFKELLDQLFGPPTRAPRSAVDEEGWDYEVLPDPTSPDEDAMRVSFYTLEDGGVEVLVRKQAEVYDGPRVMVKDYDDVAFPVDAANLQPPSPSNPGGASHVVLVDHPTYDELERLVRDGFYDLVSLDTIRGLRTQAPKATEDTHRRQKRVIQGEDPDPDTTDPQHRTFTRYTCFDVYDLDGDGQAEDVMWWVLEEQGLLLRARPLTEVYPVFDGEKPWRPIAHTSYLPVKGSVAGVSLLELIEGLHDIAKATLDMTIDFGWMANFPFGFYRPASTIEAEVLRPTPGDLIPTNDPSAVSFPQMGSRDQTFGFNMLAVVDGARDRLTLLNDLRAGQIPRGKSAALRTAEGIELLLSQSESRPERILRRFFIGWVQVATMMHKLNRSNLRTDKQFRVTGVLRPGEDPYQTVQVKTIRAHGHRFTFDANVLNASKQAMQTAVQQALGMLVNPFMLQMGVVDANGIYRLVRDGLVNLGLQPDEYVKAPAPEARQPAITAYEAFAQILKYRAPSGVPAEGGEAHLATLQEVHEQYVSAPDTPPELDPQQMALFKVWATAVAQVARAEAQQQAVLQAAAAEQQRLQGGGPDGRRNGAGVASAASGPGRLGPGELRDEGLPGAQGRVQ